MLLSLLDSMSREIQHWATERVILVGLLGLLPYNLAMCKSFFLGFAYHVLYALVTGLGDRHKRHIGCSLFVAPGRRTRPSRGVPCAQAPAPTGVGRLGVRDPRSSPISLCSSLRAGNHLQVEWVLIVLNLYVNLPLFYSAIFLCFSQHYPTLPLPSLLAVCLGSDGFGDCMERVPPVGANG